MAQRTIEPLLLECMDGEKRGFLLSMHVMRELAKQGVGPGTNQAEAVVVALHLALVDSTLSQDELAKVLPPDTELLLNFWKALKDHCSSKGNEQYRPMKVGAEVLNGSSSSHSGESGSDSQ